MADWNPQANALFLDALDRPAGPARSAYLNQVCDGDEDLKAQVVALLEASERAGEFLSSPAQELRQAFVDAAGGERPSSVIGPYKLLQEIGEGGMGVVYMAEQSQPVRRTVALKIIKPGMDSRQVVARFEAERQALALMDHPNIAKVFDAGTTQTGRPFFAMELVKGTPITEYCDEHQLTPRHRLELFLPVCKAIGHAHQKGIIHRDLKPSNVMVAKYDGQPVPKVIDFGVSKATGPKLTEKTLFTEFGAVVGTFEYMSPEQAELNQLDVDTRSDIYSLGVLLYELLTGTTPLARERTKDTSIVELLRLVREDEPPRPSTRLGTAEELPSIAARRGVEPKKLTGLVKGDLDSIVMKALDNDHNRRYETANSLANDIARYLGNEPVEACPPSKVYRLQKAWRRNKLVYNAGVAVFLALAVGLTLAAFGWLQALTQRKQAQANEGRAIQEQRRAELEREENRRRAYAAEMRAAFHALDENNLERASELLIRQQPKAGEEDLRGFEWRHLWQLCQSDVKFTLPDADADHPVFSPDGRWLAYGGKRIVIRELPSRDEVVTIPTAATTLAFSPDGKLLASGHDSHVKLWSTESWEEEQTLPDARYPAVFSPDSRWLVTGAAGGYRVWNTKTWQPATPSFCPGEPQTDRNLWPIYGVAFSPDGRLLVTAGHKDGYDVGQFQVWDFPSLTLRPNFSPQAFELASAVFTPDSKHLLIGEQTGGLMVWDVADGRLVKTLNEHTGGITTITYARDGRTMATSSRDRTLAVWDWDARKPLVRLRGDLGEISSAAISPDGRILASGSREGTIRLWDPSTRHHKRRTLEGCSLIIGFSADSRLLVVKGYKDFRVWSLEDGVVKTVPLDNFVHRGSYGWSDVHGIEPHAAFGRFNGILEHWNLATMSRIASWQVHEGAVSTAAFSPDGRLIATSGTTGDVKLWDPATHTEVRSFAPGGKTLRCLVFSPDGRLLAGAEFTNDDPRVCIWDVDEGRLLQKLDGYYGLGISLAFSPDGKLLATPHADNNVRLWEIPSRKLKGKLQGHVGLVNSVAFSPDGKTLATGSFDRNVKLWNIATQQEVATLETLPGSCSSLRFSLDGRTLAAGSWMGSELYMSLFQAPSFEEIASRNAALKTESKQP